MNVDGNFRWNWSRITSDLGALTISMFFFSYISPRLLRKIQDGLCEKFNDVNELKTTTLYIYNSHYSLEHSRLKYIFTHVFHSGVSKNPPLPRLFAKDFAFDPRYMHKVQPSRSLRQGFLQVALHFLWKLDGSLDIATFYHILVLHMVKITYNPLKIYTTLWIGAFKFIQQE